MPTPPDTAQDQVDTRLGTVVSFARAQVGKPYVFGAVGPNSFDCSGLVVAAYRQVGLTLVHWTGALIATGEEVSKSDLQLGDLVFPDSGHVQIYSGNGNIIEAPHAGANVREGPMGRFWRARRVIGGGSKSKGVVETIVGAVNAVSPLDNALELAQTANRALTNMTNPQFWARAGQYAIGFGLVIVGLLWISRRQLMAGAGMVGRQIGSLGETAVQGAAFGFGASKGGGIGGGARGSSIATQMGNELTARSQRVPSPPPPAQLPAGQVTAVPVTSPANPVSPYRTPAIVGRARRPPAPLVTPEGRQILNQPLPGAKRHRGKKV